MTVPYMDPGMGMDPTKPRPKPLGPLNPGGQNEIARAGVGGTPTLGPLQPGTAAPTPFKPVNSTGAPPGAQAPAATAPAPGTFGPGNNLVGSQINPTASADTTAARSQLGSLFAGIGPSAPNRLDIAKNALKTFDEQQADTEKLGVQDIGREAAAAGRLGSGMVSTSLGDLQTRLARDRAQEERGLAGDVAGQTLNDRLAALSGTEGALGQLSGLDTSSQDALRGERGYQATQDQQAIDNLVRQFGLESGAQAQDFGQQADTAGQLASLGFGGGSDATLSDVAGTYDAQGNALLGGAGSILQNYFANRGKKPPATGGTPYNPATDDIYAGSA